MQGIEKLKDKKINCIPNNTEKYISYSTDNLDFIDSLQFVNASLEKLVSNLSKTGRESFSNLHTHNDNDKVSLLLRKGIYPFEERHLPPVEYFYRELNAKHITNADYLDYHDLYLLSDVLLLADVFENFRYACLNAYNVNPCYFYASPGLALQACLKMSGVEIELLTDPVVYLFIEEGLRGGISVISKRYSKANNPYIPNYNADKETSYEMYLDANNLYGWAMSQPLPTGEFDWLTEEEIAAIEVEEVPNDSERGYILEVDISYPTELHDLHNGHPLAPEKNEDFLRNAILTLSRIIRKIQPRYHVCNQVGSKSSR